VPSSIIINLGASDCFLISNLAALILTIPLVLGSGSTLPPSTSNEKVLFCYALEAA
jgi:hypothetical protein